MRKTSYRYRFIGFVLKGILLTCLVAAPSCQTQRRNNIRNVILISIDALRPDFLGCYNPNVKTTPNIDRFASENVISRNVIAQAASTVMSHKSILYSLYPSIHKASKQTIPQENIRSPIEVLRSNGFKTTAIVGGGQLSKKFGFAKGFEQYWEPSKKIGEKEPIREFNQRVMSWLKQNYKQKFVLFLHTYEVHCPYEPREEYARKFTSWYHGGIDPTDKCGDTFYNKRKMTSEDYRFVRDLYAAHVKEVDDFIGVLLSQLKSLKIYDDTLIAFFSDHGESLGERKYIGHNQLYDVQLRIPLILHIPGIHAASLNSLLEAIDIVPTVFDALNIKNSFSFQGRSILPLLQQKSEVDKERIRISEQVERVAVRKGDWVLIFSKNGKQSQELYYLPQDPEEVSNLSLEYGMIADQMRPRYYEMLKKDKDLAARFIVTPSSKPKLDEETEEQLKALGYVD